MSKGFNLEAYRSSQKDESLNETFDVDLGESKDDEGNVRHDAVSIPNIKRWPIAAQAKFGDGDIVGGMNLLVGPEGAELFEQYNWTLGEVEALFEALAEWSGFQTGPNSVQRPTLVRTPTSNSPSSGPTESTS